MKKDFIEGLRIFQLTCMLSYEVDLTYKIIGLVKSLPSGIG